MMPSEQDWKRLKLRRDGVCAACGLPLQTGTTALWSASQRIVSCVVHPSTTNSIPENVEQEVVTPTEPEAPISQGNAGGSARVEHDRLIPKSRANIDHLAITKSGVFVIDAKNYQGVVRVKDSSGFFEKSAPELWVGKRNCMKLVGGMKKQTSIVKEVLQGNSIAFPVVGVLAFYAADWETFKFLRAQLEVDGVLINSKGIEAIVSREGSLSAQEIDAATHCLATKLVSAT